MLSIFWDLSTEQRHGNIFNRILLSFEILKENSSLQIKWRVRAEACQGHPFACQTAEHGISSYSKRSHCRFLPKSNTGWIFLCVLYKSGLAEHIKVAGATPESELRWRANVSSMLSADKANGCPPFPACTAYPTPSSGSKAKYERYLGICQSQAQPFRSLASLVLLRLAHSCLKTFAFFLGLSRTSHPSDLHLVNPFWLFRHWFKGLFLKFNPSSPTYPPYPECPLNTHRELVTRWEST